MFVIDNSDKLTEYLYLGKLEYQVFKLGMRIKNENPESGLRTFKKWINWAFESAKIYQM